MNPLTDLIPPKARRWVYAVAFVAMLAWAAWTAAEGDWRKAVALFLASLVPALAGSNVNKPQGGDPQP